MGPLFMFSVINHGVSCCYLSLADRIHRCARSAQSHAALPEEALDLTTVGEVSGEGGTHFLPRAEQPTEDLLPPLGNWTSPLNPPLPFFLVFLFWGLASNYLILFTLHPSFMVQKTCRCKYVPPSLTSPPFLIYVISIFLPCTVN